MTKKNKIPWPTNKAMEQIYELNMWGNNAEAFYSGSGSHESFIVEPYIKGVTQFLSSFETPLTVCNLGCGDFNIGKQLVKFTKSYIGIDIVPKLIEYNTKHFSNHKLKFECLDIANSALPNSDCAIIRQVLQHLSNDEIKKIVKKLSAYKYVILTEHIPDEAFEPNIDIISGQGIRLKKKSGVDITQEPFNFNYKKEKQLISVELPKSKGIIKTCLYIT